MVSADGRQIAVASIGVTEQDLTAYNLTIDHLRTYYVLAGDTPVLVHNCNFRPGAADEHYDEHVLGLDDAGNPTRKPDMPEYDYDGGFEQYVDDACGLMCSGCRPGPEKRRAAMVC